MNSYFTVYCCYLSWLGVSVVHFPFKNYFKARTKEQGIYRIQMSLVNRLRVFSGRLGKKSLHAHRYITRTSLERRLNLLIVF